MQTPNRMDDSTKKGMSFDLDMKIKARKKDLSPADGADINTPERKKSGGGGLCVSMCAPNEGQDGGSSGPKLISPF